MERRSIVDDLDEDERAAWRYLESRAVAYPRLTERGKVRVYPPWRSPTRPDKPRRLIAAELVAVDTRGVARRPGGDVSVDDARILGIVYSDGSGARYVDLSDDRSAVDVLIATFLHTSTRGAFLCFWGARRRAFHLILRHCAPGLVARGYQVRPIASGAEVKALIISKGRHRWTWTDVGAMTATTELDLGEYLTAFGWPSQSGEPDVQRLWHALTRVQAVMLGTFGVALRPTLGASAVIAAARCLPRDLWIWRPPPFLVALARAGGGYRGGYVYASKYVGQGWKIDINKLYTWCLSQPLPARVAVGWCEQNGEEQPGIYLCHVDGPGSYPVYLGIWGRGGFWVQQWCGESCLCVLPSAEFAGLRALGYKVRPRAGYVFTHLFDLGTFTRKIATLTETYERWHPVHAMAKVIGNATYGKLAESSERSEVCYSERRPGPGWHPFMADAADGAEEVANVWLRRSTVHRAHQHVDVAATVTAHGRTRLYTGIADLAAGGVRVVAADTDGLIVSDNPIPHVDMHSTRLGAWRFVGFDPTTVVAGRRAYVFGAETHVAGIQGATREHVELMMSEGEVTVKGTRGHAPWTGGPSLEAIDVTLHAIAQGEAEDRAAVDRQLASEGV